LDETAINELPSTDKKLGFHRETARYSMLLRNVVAHKSHKKLLYTNAHCLHTCPIKISFCLLF